MENKSFTVLPMSQRFNLEPGETYSGSISVVNPADASNDFVYSATLIPYSVTDEDYTADLTTETNRTQIVNWIKIDEPTGRIAPNESKKINFTITVPENAPAGGQYGAIAISSHDDSSSSNGVSIDSVFELASLIYANVNGETVHKGEILQNNFPGFVVSSPVALKATLTNEGNVHEDATFVITATNLFSGEVILPSGDNNGQYNELIMPESTRVVVRNLDNLPMLGVVKVSQKIYYQGEVSTVESNVIICPIWFMFLVFATILAIITTIVRIVFKHKKQKTDIV